MVSVLLGAVVLLWMHEQNLQTTVEGRASHAIARASRASAHLFRLSARLSPEVSTTTPKIGEISAGDLPR